MQRVLVREMQVATGEPNGESLSGAVKATSTEERLGRRGTSTDRADQRELEHGLRGRSAGRRAAIPVADVSG